MAIRIPNLTELTTGTGYILTGSTGFISAGTKVCAGSPITHPTNHSATGLLVTYIAALAETYNSATSAILGVNDMSLPWGGLLDFCGDWDVPHILHRSGHSFDVDGSTMSQVQKQYLTDRAEKLFGLLPVKEGTIHYELPY